MKMRSRALVATTTAFALIAGTFSPALAAEAPADGDDLCPSVVVVAARGSEQNEEFPPTSYAEGSPWVSNGFEGPNIKGFLKRAQQHHLDTTGESLMEDVLVMGLDDEIYPADFPVPKLAEDDEELETLEMVRRVQVLLAETPAQEIVGDSLQSFAKSLRSGVRGVRGMIEGYEASTGCAPGYILIGYSQGALVLAPHEKWLQESGRLVGSIYFGSPLVTAGDRTAIGTAAHGGMLKTSSENAPDSGNVNKLNYCLPDDFVCDLSVDAVSNGIQGASGGVHATYFLDGQTQPEDASVAERFAGWVSGYTSRS
ncbi:hypothetical protein [Corynebacterium alimapuense]|uniref:Cutinase n=1 Tax=Corynebacterium alimapuense TaxID=1576874 RepID=A0A3M8K8Y7_9CORY|nr:hypothetical protein [Corynebacterium alimapuense]RNE49630.1 hypothetical protein C5L39_04630 [Corynebacterium alimapuense]